MKKTAFLGLIATLAVFSSCGGDSTPPIAFDKYQHSYQNEGQAVILEGYLSPGSFSMVRDHEISVGLYSSPAGSGEKLATISMEFGKRANRIYMPEKYSDDDVEIYDSDGQKHDYKTKLKIVGAVKYTKKDWENDLVEEALPAHLADNATMKRMNKEKAEKAKKAAEERKEKQSGDPNDYSFEIELSSVTVAE
jgi:hypothetical protein